jgi:hypothetical protein
VQEDELLDLLGVLLGEQRCDSLRGVSVCSWK